MKTRKNYGVTPIIIVTILFAVAAFVTTMLNNFYKETAVLTIGSSVFKAGVVRNDGTQIRAVTDGRNFDSEGALIIVFPSDGKWQVGSEAIKASVDVVWLNSEKKVVYIMKGATPDNSASQVFIPKDNARYVLELPSGTVEERAITINTKAYFVLEEAEKA